jgi:hypothetical protein
VIAIVEVPPFLLLLFVGSFDTLIRLLAVVIRLLYTLTRVVALEGATMRPIDEMKILLMYLYQEGCMALDFGTRCLGCDPTRQVLREEPNRPK